MFQISCGRWNLSLSSDCHAISALVIAIKRRDERRKVAEYLSDNEADPNAIDFQRNRAYFMLLKFEMENLVDYY